MHHITELLTQISECSNKAQHVLLEIGAGQAHLISSLIDSLFPHCCYEFKKDLNGIDRVVTLDTKSHIT